MTEHETDPSRGQLLQTGWFVESLMTQTLIIHVIRNNRIPFIQSRASWPLKATTLSIMYWPILLLTLGLYEPYASDQGLVAAGEVDLNGASPHRANWLAPCGRIGRQR
jgi:magnesium-transporting ATPase (P-type)